MFRLPGSGHVGALRAAVEHVQGQLLLLAEAVAHRLLHLSGGGAELPGADLVDIANELALVAGVLGLAARVVGAVEDARGARGPVLDGRAPDGFFCGVFFLAVIYDGL